LAVLTILIVIVVVAVKVIRARPPVGEIRKEGVWFRRLVVGVVGLVVASTIHVFGRRRLALIHLVASLSFTIAGTGLDGLGGPSHRAAPLHIVVRAGVAGLATIRSIHDGKRWAWPRVERVIRPIVVVVVVPGWNWLALKARALLSLGVDAVAHPIRDEEVGSLLLGWRSGLVSVAAGSLLLALLSLLLTLSSFHLTLLTILFTPLALLLTHLALLLLSLLLLLALLTLLFALQALLLLLC